MLFKDNFYSIIEQSGTEESHFFNVKLDATHPIFKGHFPGNPVTPGVVQMEMVKELASISIEKDLDLIRMANCKFLALLNPNETPSIDVNLTVKYGESNELKVSAVISHDETNFLKMSAEYLVK